MNTFITNIVFDLIKNKSLNNITPIKLKFFNGNIDKTLDLFGISEYIVSVDKWTAASNKQIQNNTNLVVGTVLQNFSGSLTIKVYSSTNVELFTYTYTTNLLVNSVYTILSNAFKIMLPNISTNLANFLLNYIFRNIVDNKPAVWFLELQTTVGSVYQNRIELNCSKFSEPYINETGLSCISYGEYISVETAIDKELKYGKLFTTSSGGTSWIDYVMFLSNPVYTGRTLEIFNNNLIISVDTNTSIDFLLPSDSDCIFYVDFDGRNTELVSNKQPLNNTVTYDSSIKLFKSESVVMDTSQALEYTDFNFPTNFTLELFIRFSTNPLGREIIFIEKTNSFKLYKNSINELCIDNQSGVILTTNWLPTVNVWYHVVITKNNTNLELKVNNDVTQSSTVSTNNTFAANSSTLKINNISKPILGHCNGLYIYSGDKQTSLLEQPVPKKAYNWNYINSQVWKDLTINQWKQYCKG